MEKVGVFLCTGCGIGEAFALDSFEEIATDADAIGVVTNPCLCAPEGLAVINKAIDDGEVDGLVIAACSHRAKTKEFTFDTTKVAVHRIDLREQVAWSHEAGHEDTLMLAEDQLRMGIVRVAKSELVVPLEEQIEPVVMVVGGGLTGLEAARAAAGMGDSVVIVEAEAKLGGYLGGVKDMVPEHPPYDRLQQNRIGDLIAAVEADAKITVHTGTTISKISGQPGQFEVELESGTSFTAGAIIQATGATPYDVSGIPELGYDCADVITSVELDKMITAGKVARPSDGKAPGRIVFVQCAGSRNPDHLPYCSSECCSTSLRQVAAIQRDFAGTECAVIYRDLRAPGQLEHFYASVQELPGSMFTRGEVTRVSQAGKGLEVAVADCLLGEDVTIAADLVVLAVGMVPVSADGEAIRTYVDAKARSETSDSEKQRAEAAKLAESVAEHAGTEILNLGYRQGPDMPVLRYKFPDSHYICFPYESRRTGIYAAGSVHAPMDAAGATEDAWGAAMKAVQCNAANQRGEAVHPRAGDMGIASFNLNRCTQCKRCTEECPFGTLDEDVKGTPKYNALRCRRCGICMGCCPERIISFPDYSPDAVGSMIKVVEVPEEDEEKPRMIAFMCENDALPALDEAARRGLKWNPWIRVIPVRCLGAVNVIWIADALSAGIDGVMLLGCKKGTDYQCHYIRGSELAEKRLENVKETLDRLALEPERIKVIELARDEYARVPELFDEFAEEIDEMGPNPMKGF